MIFSKFRFTKANIIRFGMMLFAFLFMGTAMIVAQNDSIPPINDVVPFGEGFSIEALKAYFNELVGGLTFVWGMIVSALKLNKDKEGVKKVPKVIPVLAGAIVIVGVVVNIGWATGIQALVSMFSTMGLYASIKGILEALGIIKKSDDPTTDDGTGTDDTVIAGDGLG